ncbi:hypothetical protein OROGR_010732 [Orobanche gracilis]
MKYMEGYSSKRGISGIIAHKKGYNVGFKNGPANTDDHNARFCNRIGCSGRIKYADQNMKIGISGKSNFFDRPSSSSSSNGQEATGNSSTRRSCLITRARNSFHDEKRKISSKSEFDPLRSSQSGDADTQELIFSPSRNVSRHHSGSKNKIEGVEIAKNGSSSAPSDIGPQKVFSRHKPSTSGTGISISDSGSSRVASGNSSISGSSNSSSNSGSGSSSKYGMRNLKCSSSESKSAGKNVMKKKIPEVESSLSRRRPLNGRLCPSTSGISISDSGSSRVASGDSKSGGSFTTRRSTNVNNGKAGLPYQQNGRNSPSLRETSLRISHVGGTQFSASSSSSGSSSFTLLSSNNDNRSAIMPFNAGRLDFMNLTDHERYNMDGIAEVLLAIERLERDEGLTHEISLELCICYTNYPTVKRYPLSFVFVIQIIPLSKVLALETNLFTRGINLYDQHRDMRLDIDNMSYEELLALEERMGTVSTALSEEALLKSVKKSIYEVGPSEVRIDGSGEDGDDMKCSICQEEYALGDETGKLVECQHGYHLTCINQWLRLKNWCPICKAAVSPQK